MSTFKKRMIIGISALVLILSLIVYFRYYFVYSEGTRVGILYKFSRKGTIFKTYEGEVMLPGIRNKYKESSMSSNMFYFSIF